jgi:tetratricopeptide (TPR) repeat protein
METLKKILAATLFVSCISFSHAQTTTISTPVQTAFSASYVSESAGNYSAAITALTNVYDEKSYEINLRLGWLNYESKNYTGSISYYQKAIDLRPYGIEARLGYVKPASALEKWDDVLAQYDAILKIDPQNTSTNYYVGMIYYNRKDYTKASSYFEKVVNLYPFDYNSSLMLGWSYLLMGKNSDAKIMFQKVLLISPGDTSALDGIKKAG